MISIIVPVFNVEDYLSDCIESLIHQTYYDLEIILVNDGSTDGSGLLCDEWAKRDQRIHVIHQSNRGLSAARNTGIKYSRGEYIGFVDSDDWIDSKMYSSLHSALIENKGDIAIGGILKVFNDESQNQMMTPTGCFILDNDDAVAEVMKEGVIKPPVWNRLYSRECIEELWFPEGKIHEDVFWNYKVLSKAKRVVVIDDLCYFYRQRSQSIMAAKYNFKRLDIVEAKIEQYSFIERLYPDLLDLAKRDLINCCIYQGQMLLKYMTNISDKTKGMKLLQNAVKKYGNYSLGNIHAEGVKQAIWFFLARKNLLLICKIRNYLNIGL